MKKAEFISLMAALMSLVALSIDTMLPALNSIGESLAITNQNDAQFIVSFIFLGMSPGLLIYGPLSDSFGRKPVVYFGISIFLLGSVISMLSTSFSVMLAGRFLQGFGASCCRIVTVAIVRDKYSGKLMGQTMSLVMIMFIMIPALAPALGQLILSISSWRAIFGVFIVFALVDLIWLGLRQEETLPPERRREFSIKSILDGVKETLSTSATRNFTLAAGLVFGALIGYISSAQQILQIQYETGSNFAYYFGFIALGIGLSSFLNSKLVFRFKMQNICIVALGLVSAVSVVFLILSVSYQGHPPFMALLGYLATTFFCFGMLFGNFNALALEPLGHIAGIANSVIASFQTLISVAIGAGIGQSYNGGVNPLVIGVVMSSILALLVVSFTKSTQSDS